MTCPTDPSSPASLEDALAYLRSVIEDMHIPFQIAPTYVWLAGINGLWSRRGLDKKHSV